MYDEHDLDYINNAVIHEIVIFTVNKLANLTVYKTSTDVTSTFCALQQLAHAALCALVIDKSYEGLYKLACVI